MSSLKRTTGCLQNNLCVEQIYPSFYLISPSLPLYTVSNARLSNE